MKKLNNYLLILLVILLVNCSVFRKENISLAQNVNNLSESKVNVNNNLPINYIISKNMIWEGKVGNYSLQWTSDDVYLSSSKQTNIGLFTPSFLKFHNTSVNEVKKFQKSKLVKDRKEWQIESKAFIKIKSIVGTFVTFEIRYISQEVTSNPSHSIWWLTLDLSKSGKIVPFSPLGDESDGCGRIADLMDIFSEESILKSLEVNKEVENSLAKQNRSNFPKSLKELFSNQGEYKDYPRLPIRSDNYFLTEASFEHFVFEKVEDNSITVKLGLGNPTESDPSTIEFLSVVLPIPEKFRESFRTAESGINGFLSNYADQIFRDKETHFSFKTKILPAKKNGKAVR